MRAYGLGSDVPFGLVHDGVQGETGFVWNDETNSVEKVTRKVMTERDTPIGNLSGVMRDATRMFVLLAYKYATLPSADSAVAIARTLAEVSIHMSVDIEDVEIFQEYVRITILVPFESAPASFIEEVIAVANRAAKKPLLHTDYFVTSENTPTPEEVMSFVASVGKSEKKKKQDN